MGDAKFYKGCSRKSKDGVRNLKGSGKNLKGDADGQWGDADNIHYSDGGSTNSKGSDRKPKPGDDDYTPMGTAGLMQNQMFVKIWKREGWWKVDDFVWQKWFCSFLSIGNGRVAELWTLRGTSVWQEGMAEGNAEESMHADDFKDLAETIDGPEMAEGDDTETVPERTRHLRGCAMIYDLCDCGRSRI